MNPVILDRLTVWKLSYKLLGPLLLLCPLFGTIQVLHDTFKSGYEKGIWEFCHLLKNGTFLSFVRLQQKYGVPSPHLLPTNHITNTENGSLLEPKPSRTDVIRIGITSKICNAPMESSMVNMVHIRRKWEQDLYMETARGLDTQERKIQARKFWNVLMISLFETGFFCTTEKLN